MRDFNQGHVSSLMPAFKDGIMSQFDFDAYTDVYAPVVFFGVYSRHDLSVVNSHKGKKIVVFMGVDMDKYAKRVSRNSDTYFVSYGPYKKKLEEIGLKVYECNMPVKDYSDFKPVELGKNIYVYLGYNGNRKGHYKWNEVIKPLIEKFGDRVIYTSGKTPTQLRDDFYSTCFAYVKPNPTAGSTTMWEVGHMGIRTFTQGHQELGYGNLVNYKNVKDLISMLEQEEERIGQVRQDVAYATDAAINKSEDWLNLSFYESR
jgi:hypothetical protein